jgi:hypothetical protein
MADYDLDEINHAFADFRAGVLPVVQPAGFQQARATARRRRTVRTTALAGLAVLAIGASVATGTALAGRSNNPPAGTGSPTPGASASATDSASPAPSGSLTSVPPDVGAAVTAPGLTCPSGKAGTTRGNNAGLVVTDLCNATLEIPAWPDAASHPGAVDNCASGQVTFTGGHHYVAASEYVDLGTGMTAGPGGAATVDLDHDGANDLVVAVSCGGQGWYTQVLAFTRDEQGGIRLLGTVLGADAVPQVTAIATTPRGLVRVEVADFPGQVGQSQPFAQRQWRSYAWADGQGRLAQVEGPTSFPVNPKVTDLAVSASGLVFDAPSGGQRNGTMTVTVNNVGASSVPFTIRVNVPLYATLAAQPGCTQESFPSSSQVRCTAGGVAAGGTKAFTLHFRAPAGADQTKVDFLPDAGVTVADGYGDPVYGNNEGRFTITMK